ncbi:MAG: GOLPH3/VPS74 family protein [Actinomycetes bacterium]
MLLAEELLLLGLSPARGTVVNGARQQLTVGLAGALVAELALDGLVELRAKTFVVAGEPPAAPLLHDTYVELASGKGRHSKGQLRRLDRALGRVWPRLTDGLVELGVLGRRQDRVLLVPVTRHPVVDRSAYDQVVDRVRRAAADDREIDPRTSVLLALSGPCRLLEVVAPERAQRPHAKQRIAEATSLAPVAPVVKAVIAEAQAAVAAAATVAAVAGSSS